MLCCGQPNRQAELWQEVVVFSFAACMLIFSASALAKLILFLSLGERFCLVAEGICAIAFPRFRPITISPLCPWSDLPSFLGAFDP